MEYFNKPTNIYKLYDDHGHLKYTINENWHIQSTSSDPLDLKIK